MTKKIEHVYDDRMARNHGSLVNTITKYLETHKVQVYNKLEKFTSYPDSAAHYQMMLDSYFMLNLDMTIHLFEDLGDHFNNILAFLQFNDDELEVKLVKGRTRLPLMFMENVHIPHTFYKVDERLFKRSKSGQYRTKIPGLNRS